MASWELQSPGNNPPNNREITTKMTTPQFRNLAEFQDAGKDENGGSDKIR
jgi:hypothetical protein